MVLRRAYTSAEAQQATSSLVLLSLTQRGTDLHFHHTCATCLKSLTNDELVLRITANTSK